MFYFWTFLTIGEWWGALLSPAAVQDVYPRAGPVLHGTGRHDTRVRANLGHFEVFFDMHAAILGHFGVICCYFGTC
jgi:hypothetical protein